ncbi:MAG: hypothetical protein L6V84_03070 [Oscillospiraceae bacterium]|nr:MAG: hypothetical protein L6V84_03070 [Oscillospiraceae bacterium]
MRGRLIPLALAVLFALGNAAIGFIDDYCKLVRHQNEGLTERQKLLLQLVLTAAYLAMLRASGHLETSLRIPFTDMRLELSWFAYPVYLLVMVGFVNATNLTDGLDGLASSVCATVAAFTPAPGSLETGTRTARCWRRLCWRVCWAFWSLTTTRRRCSWATRGRCSWAASSWDAP